MRRFDERSTAAWPTGAFHTLDDANSRCGVCVVDVPPHAATAHVASSTTASVAYVRTPLTSSVSADEPLGLTPGGVITVRIGTRRRARVRVAPPAPRARTASVLRPAPLHSVRA